MTTLLRGTMLAPGVSANKRLYTPELIQRAHDKLAERIKSGTQPVTMLTYHGAEDDSTQIVGRVTSVKLVDGRLDYTAELADTKESETIGKLVAPKDGKPFLRGVSIRGWWVGDPTSKTVEGQTVTTADDMEIDGLDFTKNPGVTGAYAEPMESGATENSTVARMVIRESVETQAVFTEAVNTKPYGSVRYADPGYQADKVKRYPLDTKAHAKAAWSYIGQAKNQKLYTAAQLKRIRARIKSALQKFGVDVTTEAAAEMPQELTEANTTLSEYYAVDGPDGTAGFCISAYNGPLTVTVSAYSGVEPADLADVAMAAMQAACDAIHALDPDDDGDIDTGASEQTPDDNQMETAPASETVKESDMGEATETSAPAEETTTETSTEETQETAAAEADENALITLADLNAAVAAAVSAALAPPSETTAETAPAVTETAEDAAAALRETIRQEVIAEAVKSGIVTRKGLVESGTTGGDPPKPLHEMNEEEWRKFQQERSALFFTHNQ